MGDTCATVKVKDANAPGGFIVINEEDFDEAVHAKLTDRQEAAADRAMEAEVAAQEKAAKKAKAAKE